jgi:hypothetical protein
MRMRWLAFLLFAGGLAVGLRVGMTGTAHASDPTRPGKPWNEVFLPFGNGKGNTMCVDVPGGTTAPGAQLQLYGLPGLRQRRGDPGARIGPTTGAGAACSAAAAPALPRTGLLEGQAERS